MPVLSEIHIFPVKGFSSVRLIKVKISNAEGLPNDRRYAITNGIADNQNGAWLTCRSFFINAVNDGLLKFAVETNQDTISLVSPNGMQLSWQTGDEQSLQSANSKIAEFMAPLIAEEGLPLPQITERTQLTGMLSGYWDFNDSGISLMNRNSLGAIASAMGQELDIRRLRGNLILDDLPAWEEFGLVGKRIRIGKAEFDILRPIQRCPATSVNPETGDRDLKVPDALMEYFGHAFCGIYAKAVKTGTIDEGDQITVIGDARTSFNEAANPADSDYKLWPKFVEVCAFVEADGARHLTLKSTSPWPLPVASTGQRIRFHIKENLIGVGTVLDHQNDMTLMSIEPSQTSDPATAYLLNETKAGDKLIVSGPFGRV